MGKIGWQLVFLGLPWVLETFDAVRVLVGAGYTFTGLWVCDAGSSSATQELSGRITDSVLVGMSFFVVIFCMGALVRFVYRIEQRMDQFLGEGQESDRTQTLATTYKGIWFTAVFFIIILLIIISSLVPDLLKWYFVLFAFVFPLQGFLYAIGPLLVKEYLDKRLLR